MLYRMYPGSIFFYAFVSVASGAGQQEGKRERTRKIYA